MHIRVHHHLPYGSSLLITGSTPQLGAWNLTKALSLKWTPGHIWTGNLPHTTNPTRFEFKFLIKDNHSTTWEPSSINHVIVIPPHTSQSATITPSFGSPREHFLSPNPPSPPSPTPTPLSTNGPTTQLLQSVANGLARRKSVTFRVNAPSGENNASLYVAGSHPALGSWNKMNAPRMLRSSNVFELTLDMTTHQQFEYKYFLRRQDQTRRWETGPNRVAEPEHGLLLDDRWDKIRIYFSIYYPAKESQFMNITGDLSEIGAWCRPGPTRMTLGPLQKLETDVMGRKWQLNVWVSPQTKSFSYRYILVDSHSKHELWEREPNRRAELDPEQVLVNSALELRDVNFVSEMMFDQVPPNMFIGPYPQSVGDVDAMADAGVTGVFNVQTDEDFKHRGIQWDVLTARYGEHNIKVVRFPIRDFDRDSLRQRLRPATHALHDLLDEGRQVYIHCTAGMGRAPACAVAYLCWVKKMELEDAVAFVKKHRKVAVPNVPVLEAALKEPY